MYCTTTHTWGVQGSIQGDQDALSTWGNSFIYCWAWLPLLQPDPNVPGITPMVAFGFEESIDPDVENGKGT
jgi:hypothetical protein